MDFISLCETYLNDNNFHLCKIDGYKLICNNRGNVKGGGVAILISKNCSYKQKRDLAIKVDHECESIFVAKDDQSTVVGEITTKREKLPGYGFLTKGVIKKRV